MEQKYERLLQLYEKSPKLFQETIEKIGNTGFDIFTLDRILDSKVSTEVEAVRRILVTLFQGELSDKVLNRFLACSGDTVTQNMVTSILEERRVKKEKLREEADFIVILFSK